MTTENTTDMPAHTHNVTITTYQAECIVRGLLAYLDTSCGVAKNNALDMLMLADKLVEIAPEFRREPLRFGIYCEREMWEEPTQPTYKIIRHFTNGDWRKIVIRSGLPLEEAQAWCQDEDTRCDEWFDAYTEDN
jgi:hypothetical protein